PCSVICTRAVSRILARLRRASARSDCITSTVFRSCPIRQRAVRWSPKDESRFTIVSRPRQDARRPGFLVRRPGLHLCCYWRRGRDSNPRDGGNPPNGFRDRRIQPLCHLSGWVPPARRRQCRSIPTVRSAGNPRMGRAPDRTPGARCAHQASEQCPRGSSDTTCRANRPRAPGWPDRTASPRHPRPPGPCRTPGSRCS
ncbi:MAG: hypothetical protein XD74_1968, partial [Actinobacteria bacterium 66_15]